MNSRIKPHSGTSQVVEALAELIITSSVGDDDQGPSNVFGILGPRGAGKTTALTQLQHALKTPRGDDDQHSRIHCLRPLDCSVVPREHAPAVAVILHLQ